MPALSSARVRSRRNRRADGSRSVASDLRGWRARSRARRHLGLNRHGGDEAVHAASAGWSSSDGLRGEAFDDVALLRIVEAGEADAALVVREDLADVVTEPPQRFDPVGGDDLAAAPD